MDIPLVTDSFSNDFVTTLVTIHSVGSEQVKMYTVYTTSLTFKAAVIVNSDINALLLT